MNNWSSNSIIFRGNGNEFFLKFGLVFCQNLVHQLRQKYKGYRVFNITQSNGKYYVQHAFDIRINITTKILCILLDDYYL